MLLSAMGAEALRVDRVPLGGLDLEILFKFDLFTLGGVL